LVNSAKTSHSDGNRAKELHGQHLIAPISSNHSSESSLGDSYTGLAKDLVAAWPAQSDFDLICKLPIGYSTHSHMHICTPYADLNKKTRPIREILLLPPPGSNPVLVARKLLFLGSILQGALSASHVLEPMRDRFSDIMSRAIDTATKLVTTNDTLTANVEGIECIMIEAMLQDYTGNLQRAWMTVRRASTVAQALGLYRDTKLSSHKFLDSATQAVFDSNQLCFRIVEMDRYLSMTLGLPISSLQTRALTSRELAKYGPLDRMARIHCILAERILSGQQTGRVIDYLLAQKDELNKAAEGMSYKWWQIPTVSPAHLDAVADPFPEVARMNYQLSHYHLILRFNLPYILRQSGDWEHVKLEAASTGRKILALYISLRQVKSGSFYCRGADYLAFIAFTVLCLVHVDSKNKTKSHSRCYVSERFAEARLSDRETMERILDTLKSMENDATASKLAHIMQNLLDIEGWVANGVRYSAVAMEDRDEAVECNGDIVDDRNTLRLKIPYFGTISVHRNVNLTMEEIARDPGWDVPGGREAKWRNPYGHWSFDTVQGGLAGTIDAPSDWGVHDDLTLQNVNKSLFSSLFSGMYDHETTANGEVSR
jgi:hypothetical protein